MALFEGNYEINFHVDSLSDERKEQFVEFIKKWRSEHPFTYDNWVENLDYGTFKSVLWGGNDPDNIVDLHSFLLDAANEFPELEADGDGNGDDVASGSWKTEYKFELKNGVLKWDENEWSQEEEEEKAAEAAADKPASGPFKLSLKEIFPNLDESRPNGLIIENGILKDFNTDYYKFLGDDSNDRFYFPPEVEVFDDHFDYFSDGFEWVIEDFVVTTNLKSLPQGGFNAFSIKGFENFYIVDAVTKETVFYSNKFLVPETSYDKLLYELKVFGNFADKYKEDPNKAIHNKRYGIAVDSMLKNADDNKIKTKPKEKETKQKTIQIREPSEFKNTISPKRESAVKAPAKSSNSEKQSAAAIVKKAIKKVKNIEFEGKIFVFDGRGTIDGVYYAEFEPNDPAIAKVKERGGIVKKDVTSKTDYFVINPKDKDIWKKYRVRDAAKQLEKRDDLKVIKLTDLLEFINK